MSIHIHLSFPGMAAQAGRRLTMAHYTASAGEKATPQAAFSPQAAACRYNPRAAGRPDCFGPDCAVHSHCIKRDGQILSFFPVIFLFSIFYSFKYSIINIYFCNTIYICQILHSLLHHIKLYLVILSKMAKI